MATTTTITLAERIESDQVLLHAIQRRYILLTGTTHAEACRRTWLQQMAELQNRYGRAEVIEYLLNEMPHMSLRFVMHMTDVAAQVGG